MKKILALIIIGFLCFSMFPMFSVHVKASSGSAPEVVCVPFHGKQLAVPHDTWIGRETVLKGTAHDDDGDGTMVAYKWDFGDGYSTDWISGVNPYIIEAKHTYTGTMADGTPYGVGKYFTAWLYVKDNEGLIGKDSYFIAIRDKTLDVEVNVAIDDGLWWLHKQAYRYTSDGIDYARWSSYSTYYTSATAESVLAFEIQGHQPIGNPEEDPYVETVKRGLNYVFSQTRVVDISAWGPGTGSPYGDPDTNGNDIGIGIASSQEVYELGMVMMAITASGDPGLTANTGPTGVVGRTYKDILTDMVDLCAWGQNDYGSARGGWRYGWNYGSSDNSVSQWPMMALEAAETNWGILAPSFVKTELDTYWLTYSQRSDGGFGYTGPDTPNIARTGTGIIGLNYIGLPADNPRIMKAINWLGNNWGEFGNYYGMYAVMKAMRTAHPEITMVGTHDWYAEYSRYLVDHQQADGGWPDYYGRVLATDWAILILTPTVTKPGPVADAGPDVNNFPPTIPLKFDASGSYHRDPTKSIVLYEWDFESDGVWDYSGTDVKVEHAYPAYYKPDGSIDWDLTAKDYTATLRVTDNSDPPLQDIDTCVIHITAPPWKPVADPDGPYEGSVGVPIQLDGSKSYDPESKMYSSDHPWYETIAKYEWDLDNDGQFDDSTEIKPSWTWETPGVYSVGLKVTDSQPSGPGGTIGPLDVDIKYTTVVIKKAVYVQGIDVSHYQGIINWSKVYNAGYKFTFIKATTGIGNKLILLSEGDEGEILYHEKNNIQADGHNWWYVKIRHFDGDYGVWIDYIGWIIREGLEKVSADSLEFRVGDKIKTTGSYWLRSTPEISEIPYWDDKLFMINMKNATDNRLLAGAYHFACPNLYLSGENLNEQAQAEAQHFLEVAGKYFQKGYLRPALDVEDDGVKLATGKSIADVANEIGISEAKKRLSQWICEWMETLRETAGGVEPILYTGPNVYSYLNDSVAKYDLWVAHWHDLNIPPNTGMWKGNWLFWQWNNLGHVSGIDPKINVDLDVFNGDMQKLNTYFVTNQPPACSIELQDNGVKIDNVDVRKFFDIYMGSSTDDTGIKQVRFSSDDVQDGIPTGEWTEWYYWTVSSGDWDTSTKIKRWAFDTPGKKEVWAEVKDDMGQTDRHCSNIFVHPGYAIIVAGQGGWREKWSIDHGANNAYRVLRNLGFNDDHIFYLNTKRPQDVDGDGDDEVDAPALLSQFKNAVNEVKDRIGNNPTPFVLYLTGHGQRDPDCFIFDENNPSEGYLWLDDLANLLNQFSSETPMLIVVGSCYSGRFITSDKGISATNRIIVTATHDDQERWSLLGVGGWERSSDRFWGNLNKGLNVKEAFTKDALIGDNLYMWLDDNGDRIGHPPNNLENDGELAAKTHIGISGTENLKLTSWLLIGKRSPGELRVYDLQNRVTGLVNGQVKEEVPNSIYYEQDEVIVIFSPSDTYRYEVVGTGEGTYGLEISFIQEGEAITFTARDIPTSANTVHQYTIDWAALSRGEEGVTVQVDSDGDGVFEHIFTSDGELTHDEFVLQTETTIDFDPDALNLKSKGKWVTAYIEFPEGYNVSDIDVSSILLNDTIPVNLSAPTAIGDYDNDGIPDLMVKFNRIAVCQLILSRGIMVGNVTLTVSGKLQNGIGFEGCDTIRVRMPGDINMDGKVDTKDISIICKAFGSLPGHPRWNPTADENEDNRIDIFDIALTCRNFGKTYK